MKPHLRRERLHRFDLLLVLGEDGEDRRARCKTRIYLPLFRQRHGDLVLFGGGVVNVVVGFRALRKRGGSSVSARREKNVAGGRRFPRVERRKKTWRRIGW